jgi:hypothetical protein
MVELVSQSKEEPWANCGWSDLGLWSRNLRTISKIKKILREMNN